MCRKSGNLLYCKCRKECGENTIPMDVCVDYRYRYRLVCCPMWYYMMCENRRMSQQIMGGRTDKPLTGTSTFPSGQASATQNPFDALGNFLYFLQNAQNMFRTATQKPPVLAELSTSTVPATSVTSFPVTKTKLPFSILSFPKRNQSITNILGNKSRPNKGQVILGALPNKASQTGPNANLINKNQITGDKSNPYGIEPSRLQ